jgi:aryl-alcohol dehydrogenase-like predicted oxidoreductase
LVWIDLMLEKLALGTASFGCAHGLGPRTQKVSENEVAEILSLASVNGIHLIDVAPKDGHCERVLGRNWPFPSPFRPSVRTLRLEAEAGIGINWLEQRLRRSLHHMGLARAEAAIIDRAEDLSGARGDALWERLLRLKDEGLVRQVGISCRPNDPVVAIARRFRPDVMQLPLSLLDQRFERNQSLSILKDMGITLEAHCVFMQGLIFYSPLDLPDHLKAFSAPLSRLRRRLMSEKSDPLHAALHYVGSLPEIDRLWIGVQSAAELHAILAAAKRPFGLNNIEEFDASQETYLSTEMLDPESWTINDKVNQSLNPDQVQTPQDPVIHKPRHYSQVA